MLELNDHPNAARPTPSAAYLVAVAQDAFDEGDLETAYQLIEDAYQALEAQLKDLSPDDSCF